VKVSSAIARSLKEEQKTTLWLIEMAMINVILMIPRRFTYPEGLLASLIGFGGVVTFDSQLVSLANEVCTQSMDDIRKL
jgi:hypothetical protein